MRGFMRRGFISALIGLALSATIGAHAADATVAVAANFTAPVKEIAAKYKELTGYTVDLSFGASGQLYAQISQGAPFDAFLSADNERPALAVKNGFAVPGSTFTYAVGKLVLWSANPSLVDKDGAVLKSGRFGHLAVANPKAAPYGAAAMEVLKALGLTDAVAGKIVTGETIGQTFQFVSSKNADLGFVAYSQAVNVKGGSMWLVPEKLYTPIVQDAVLLKSGENNAVAKGFLKFLRGKEAAAIIKRYGYALSPAK